MTEMWVGEAGIEVVTLPGVDRWAALSRAMVTVGASFRAATAQFELLSAVFKRYGKRRRSGHRHYGTRAWAHRYYHR